jgi:hypothetical protein
VFIQVVSVSHDADQMLERHFSTLLQPATAVSKGPLLVKQESVVTETSASRLLPGGQLVLRKNSFSFIAHITVHLVLSVSSKKNISVFFI